MIPSGRQRPTPEQCEAIFFAALHDGDARGVEAALLCMAPQDPHRAEYLSDALRIGLFLATKSDTAREVIQ